MKPEIEKISQGLTFKGIISAIGSIIFVGGLILTISLIKYNSSFLGIASGITAIIPGLVIFVSLRGVLIDHDKKMIKTYLDQFIVKTGRWTSLDKYDSIKLKYKNESQRMNSRGSSQVYHSRYFDIFLASGVNNELYLKGFINYEDAKAFLLEYSKKLNKPSTDIYEQIKQQIEERKLSVRK